LIRQYPAITGQAFGLATGPRGDSTRDYVNGGGKVVTVYALARTHSSLPKVIVWAFIGLPSYPNPRFWDMWPFGFGMPVCLKRA